MNEFIWCHGSKCHKSHTQDRIRGSKGSKVLRTRKIKQHTHREWYHPDHVFNYFCSQGCLMDFMRANINRIVALAPRNTPLDTPINDPKKEDRSYYGRWTITEKGIDTDSNVG